MRKLNVKNSDAPVDCPDAVKLMTIHSSKGLEFPAVILPVLASAANDVKGRFLMHPSFGMAFDTTRNKDEDKPPSFQVARYMEKDMLVAEKKRLLYVAMTRSRDYLALFVERGSKGRVSFRSWINDILDIDTGDELTPDGIHSLKANGASAAYRVSNLDHTVLAAKMAAVAAQQAANKGSDDLQIAKPDFSLMEQVIPAPRDLPFDWQKTTRVTNSQAKLDATTLGIFFHSVIERLTSKGEMPSDKDLLNIATLDKLRISNAEMQQELMSRVKSLLTKFYPSDLAKLIASAKQVFYETPYVTITTSQSKPDDKRTDMILQDSDGQWHVVDFKTDHFDLKDLDHKISEHKQQLQQYRKDLESITGKKFKAALYFAEHAVLAEAT
jgi:ATP-dependent exoDNAse (exonuclease V) beta subunit